MPFLIKNINIWTRQVTSEYGRDDSSQPHSDLSPFFCRMMEWGLLSLEQAKKVYEKKLKKAQQLKLVSPVKTVSDKKTAKVSVKKKKETVSKTSVKVTKKRKASDSEADDDEDFIVHKKTNKKQKVSS